MLFKDIVSTHYKIFSRLGEEERNRQIANIKYIENLASMAGVDISEWNAVEMFGSGSGNKIVNDKNEVNRRFFEHLDKLTAETVAESSSEELITSEMKSAIKAAEARHVTTLIAREQNQAESNLRTALTKYREYEGFLKIAAEANANVRKLSGGSAGIEEQIKQVNAGNFWKFVGVAGGVTLEFVTKADVIISHKNSAAGVDITINFGRYKALFSLTDFSMKVVAHERNIFHRGYPHPHIMGSGSICWGSAQGPASRDLAACQIVQPMTLLAAVISSYNKESPYVSMETFNEELGTIEERQDRAILAESLQAQREVFARIDRMEVDLDRRRTPAVVATTAPAPAAEATIAINTEALTAPAERAADRPRRARRRRPLIQEVPIVVPITPGSIVGASIMLDTNVNATDTDVEIDF